MVYGRYNELVNGDYFMVYKPTFTSLWGPILWVCDDFFVWGLHGLNMFKRGFILGLDGQ